jgi:hypothetical protein
MKTNIKIKKEGKVIERIYSTKGIDELNAVIHGEVPNKFSEIEQKYGKGAYAIRTK